MKTSRIAIVVVLMVMAACDNSSAQWKRGPVGIGVNVGMQHYVGDWNRASLGAAAELMLRASLANFFSIALHTGYGELADEYDYQSFHTSLLQAEARGTLMFLPSRRVSPLVYFGGGGFFYEALDRNNQVLQKPEGGNYKGWDRLGFLGGGLDIMLNEKWSLSFTGDYHYTTSDGLDGNSSGGAPDGFYSARAGLMFNIGGEHDSDHDGIPDKRDADKFAAEDFDGFQDDDGKPDYDNDADAIPDLQDKAPLVAEDHDGYQDEDGIPDTDNDEDGVPDALDRAPNQPEDRDGWNDDDGAPDPDNDNDGIPDVTDSAPNLAEDKDGYQDEDGAPDVDNDGDHFADSLDVSPNLPENYNGFEDFDGAPDVRPLILKDEKIILAGVGFNSGSTVLTGTSYAFLDELLSFLKQTPEAQIEIQGHTDSQGDELANMRLSVRRAEAVRVYLISRGIKDDRLVALGYGEGKPVAGNDTDEGRRANRRIEVLRMH